MQIITNEIANLFEGLLVPTMDEHHQQECGPSDIDQTN